MSQAEIRESALFNFYRAERNAGASPIEANERMGEYAKRLDELFALKNQVGWVGRKETDGMPVLAEAFSRLKLG